MKNLLTVVCPIFLGAMTASAQVIVNDSFADIDIAATGPLQASWNYSSTSGGIEIDANGLGMVSGSSGRGIHGAFGSTANLAVGSTITATFAFTTPATIGNKTDAFRIALLSSNGTDMSQGFSASSSSPEPLLDAPTGYWTDFNIDGTSASDLDVDFRESLSARSTGRLLATSSGWSGIGDDNNVSYQWKANQDYIGSFSVTFLGASSVDLTTSLTEVGTGEIISTTLNSDSTGAVSSFDAIAFHANSDVFGSTTAADPDNGLTFTNVMVEVSAIPEPSAIGLLLGAFALGFVARRRR